MTFKQKWDNYWYHYKWHTIGAVFALFLIITIFYSCSHKQEPDLYMVYLSNAIVTDESVDKIETGIIEKASLEDVDGDEKIIVFMEHIVSQFDVNAYVDEATAGKIQTVMFGGQHTLMLVHRYALEDYDGIFENLEEVEKEGDKTFKSPSEGFVSGISVEGNKYLENLGINTKDLYVAMRRRSPKELKDKEKEKYFTQAYKAMDYILSCQR